MACVGAESTESQAGERGGASEQGEVGVTCVCQCRLLRTGFASLTDRGIPTISDLLTLRTFVGRAVRPHCRRVVAAYSLVLAGCALARDYPRVFHIHTLLFGRGSRIKQKIAMEVTVTQERRREKSPSQRRCGGAIPDKGTYPI